MRKNKKTNRLRQQVCSFGERKLGKKVFAQFTVLFPSPGCQQQNLHKDEPRDGVTRDFVSSCIIPLEPGTTLDLATNINSGTRDTLPIHPGTFIFFCGSQVHGGSAYPTLPNLRVHFYLHQDQAVLDLINKRGTIKEIYHCEAGDPSCSYLPTYSFESLRKHYAANHKEWWKDYLKDKKKNTVKKPPDDANDVLYCEAAGDECRGLWWKSQSGRRKHYNAFHSEWWTQNNPNLKYCNKNRHFNI